VPPKSTVTVPMVFEPGLQKTLTTACCLQTPDTTSHRAPPNRVWRRRRRGSRAGNSPSFLGMTAHSSPSVGHSSLSVGYSLHSLDHSFPSLDDSCPSSGDSPPSLGHSTPSPGHWFPSGPDSSVRPERSLTAPCRVAASRLRTPPHTARRQTSSGGDSESRSRGRSTLQSFGLTGARPS